MLVGDTISHYKILGKLGEGGMGVVYKATDTKLNRLVALKFLIEKSVSSHDRKRFVREAQAAAALSHPNICTIHEIDDVGGQIFFSMAYAAGQTLESLIAGRVEIGQALDIATQVAGGLAYAHQNGVVHRDVKPSNIIVSDDGHASILDFGLAQMAGAGRLTKTGTTMGTAAFMSPEQARGETLDHRTDIWSLGTVLYEMITGKPAFSGEYELARMYCIVNENPTPIANLVNDPPEGLQEIIDKALAKKRDSRYASAAEMAADIRGLEAGVPTFAANRSAAATKVDNRSAAPTLAHDAKDLSIPPARGSESTSIAVMPFRSLSADPEDGFMADGIASEVVSALSGVPGVRVAPLLATFRFKDRSTALTAVASTLHVRYVLTGSLQRAGNRIRVVAELADAVEEKLVWSHTYQKGIENLFLVQEEIAKAIVGATGGQLIRATAERASIASPESLDAWGLVRKAYHFMNQAYNSDATVDASNLLRQAIELAPDYAPAHAFLGFYLTQCVINQVSPDRAADREKAIAAVERATKLAPGDPEVLENSGLVYSHTGKASKAVPILRRAVEIAPFNLVAWGIWQWRLAGAAARETRRKAFESLTG